jgi:transcriptional regulatory protein RtcR
VSANKSTIVITLAGDRPMKPGPWSSWQFVPDYIGNPAAFLAILQTRPDPVSQWLYDEKLDSKTRALIDSYNAAMTVSAAERAILAGSLNQIVKGGRGVCDAQIFQSVNLRPETEELRKDPTSDPTLLNRLLLEDAYPDKLWKHRDWQSCAELCHPSHGRQVDRCEILREKKFAGVAEKIGEAILRCSPATKIRQHSAEFDDPWDFEQVYLALEQWASGYRFDSEHEEYLVHIVRGTSVQQICLFALVESKQIPGILAHNSPPDMEFPLGKIKLVDLDLSKYDRISARFAVRQENARSSLKKGINTRNAGFNKLISEIERVAANTKDPILLLGPTGAGKSELASRIFDLRKERKLVTGPFVTVNCATIRGEGAISTLFGHVPGAYTGAKQRRHGFLRAADKGLLFLDEIGDLPLDAQTMLLRALDTKKFVPLGAEEEEFSDFQLISATNRDLQVAVRNGLFRGDLLARIELWSYVLPALRERPEDIQPNLEFELDQVRRATGKRVRMSKDVIKRFLRFAQSPEALWTANFRSLKGMVTRMATLAENGVITATVLDQEISRLKEKWTADHGPEDCDALLRPLLGDEKLNGLDLIDRFQLASVIEVCRQCESAADAGRKLFAATRHQKSNDSDRIKKYLANFGLHFSDLKA